MTELAVELPPLAMLPLMVISGSVQFAKVTVVVSVSVPQLFPAVMKKVFEPGFKVTFAVITPFSKVKGTFCPLNVK